MQKKKTYKPSSKWKYVISGILSIIFIYLFGFIYSFFLIPNTKPIKLPYTKKEIKEAVDHYTYNSLKDGAPANVVVVPKSQYRESDAFFAKNPNASKKEVDKLIKENKLPKWYPRNQSPILDSLVKNGTFPSVAERVGPEPLVLKGCDGIGKYGGTWTRLADTNSKSDLRTIDYRLGTNYLFRYNPMGLPVEPNIAKSAKSYKNGRVWDITLRKGIKWSDGVPVTADDIMYWWNYEENNDKVYGPAPGWMRIKGKVGKIEKINKYTVRFTFAAPNVSLLKQLAVNTAIRPKHYLSKYNPVIGDQELIKKEMKEYGFNDARQFYNDLKKNILNPEKPTLTPWMLKRYTDLPPMTAIRNPYFYGVDEAGNQLPYIDRVYFESIDSSMIPVAAAEGRTSMQFRRIENFSLYTDLMSKSQSRGTKVLSWYSGSRASWSIMPNINRAVDKDAPVTKFKAELLEQKEFRQALSLAIDRQPIINAVLYGIPKPSQIEPGIFSPFHSEKLANAFIKYNPKEANKLLDKTWKHLGLDPYKRIEGYRCTPSGNVLTMYLMMQAQGAPEYISEFVQANWAKVGIRLIVRKVSRAYFDLLQRSKEFDFLVWGDENGLMPLVCPFSFIAFGSNSRYATGWGIWNEKGGLSGSPDAKNPGCIPVPKSSPMYKAMELYQKAISTTSIAKQKQYMNSIMNIAAENVWTISLCEATPVLGVAVKDIKNVPYKAINCTLFGSPTNSAPETYFFEHPKNIGVKDTIKQFTTVKPWPKYNRSSSDSSSAKKSSAINVIGGIIYWIVILAVVFGLVILCIRHKFVLKRLIIMIPTLIVVSVCVFTIIQAPPGNFVNAKIMELQSLGYAPQQVESEKRSLEEMFHYEDPSWEKYLRWTGIKWFTTFNDQDKGLLQGYMGRSMESKNSVNSMVGDRVLLTFLISLGTIIFTWLFAIPIGIYSACRQYSWGDYVFTFFGFLGMCIPGFLFALIILALTGMSGLFSPEYSIQPFWDLGKVIDLLKHIWIPILIVGVSGTASMIRVMRANLLDELKRPYVTTARAKGVRPFKLLMKYPVRLAFNPFISGIGALFPALLSGSSIVAIVLSLPTIAPMLLNSLQMQDTYLSASLLMTMSILSVIGTLASDLLLIAFDPRIRLTGNSK